MSPPSRVSQITDDNLRALFADADPHALYDSFQSVGSGNFGTVFYAQDKTTKQVVAIKKIHYSADDRNKKEETWRMVVKEITVMHQCNHQHLVRYHNCFLRSPEVYIVMEYCLGSTADILNVNESSLSEPEIAVICNQTLQALVYLHDKNFIHRDVKACNILLSSDGKVKLGDFGTVSLTNKAASFIGTPYWMAPEVIKSEDEIIYTQTIDVWSLGICCFEFTTGYPPYHAMHVMAALYHIPNNKPDLKPFQENNYSPDFLNFVSDCFKDFEDRPTSKYLLENDPFISAERPANMLPNLLERTIHKVEQAQRSQTSSNKLKLNGKQKLLLAPVATSGNTPAIAVEQNIELSSPGSDSNGGSWTPDGSEVVNHYSRTDSVDEPVYRNLLPDAASANGGYENLESVASSGANQSKNTTTDNNNKISSNSHPHPSAPASGDAHNIYQNQEAPGFPRGQQTTPGGTPSEGMTTKQMPQVANVAAASQIISLSPSRMEQHPNMMHGHSLASQSTLGGGLSKIATIKTQNLQQQEEKSKLEMREQMSGYKEMRREHQKQIQALEAKCKAEEASCTNKIQQEYDQEKQRASKEEAKARHMDGGRLQQKDREVDKKVGKLQEQLRQQQNNERKKFDQFQKKYKKGKETEIKELLGAKKELQAHELASLETETSKSREEAETIWACQMTERIWNTKRQLLMEKLELDNEVLNGEMQRRSVELDLTNRMIIRHHEQWANLQKEHQRQVQDLRYKLMSEQHEIELTNHKRHHHLSLKNLEKQHQEETRSQPKLIKDKEKQIQNQLASALDTQNKQFMQLKQLRIEEAPRESHRDVAKKLEHELSSKQDILKIQYRESIERMKESNETNLKRQHQQEEEELKQRLQRDMETLINYQKQVRFQTEQQRNKERQELEKKIETRFKNVQKNIDEGRKKFAEEKKMREAEKRRDHAQKLKDFQAEYERAMAPHSNFQGTPQFNHSGFESSGIHTPVSDHLPDTPISSGSSYSQRSSRVFDTRFSEMSIDNDGTPPPPIPRTTSIKQSIDSRGQQGTLLQLSQRSSTSSTSSFQDGGSSCNNSMMSSASQNTPMILRNNSNLSSGGGKMSVGSSAAEYFHSNLDNSSPLMAKNSHHASTSNSSTPSSHHSTSGTRL